MFLVNCKRTHITAVEILSKYFESGFIDDNFGHYQDQKKETIVFIHVWNC